MCHLCFMTGLSRPWRIAGAIYVLAVLIFATYVYALDFDLIRFLWLGTAPLGLAVPYVAYLASVPLILLGLVDPVDGNGLVPLLILLWTLAAAGNVMIARSIWNALRSRCPRQVSTLVIRGDRLLGLLRRTTAADLVPDCRQHQPRDPPRKAESAEEDSPNEVLDRDVPTQLKTR